MEVQTLCNDCGNVVKTVQTFEREEIDFSYGRTPFVHVEVLNPSEETIALEECDLRARVEELARSVGVPLRRSMEFRLVVSGAAEHNRVIYQDWIYSS